MYVSKIHPENFEIDIVHNLYTTQRAAGAKVGRIEWMKNFMFSRGRYAMARAIHRWYHRVPSVHEYHPFDLTHVRDGRRTYKKLSILEIHI